MRVDWCNWGDNECGFGGGGGVEWGILGKKRGIEEDVGWVIENVGWMRVVLVVGNEERFGRGERWKKKG